MHRPTPRSARRVAATGLAAVLAVGGAAWMAQSQVGGERGIAPVAVSRDIEVGGIAVDVRAATGSEAREKGWQEAQRKAWEKIGGPALADGTLSSLVSAIVVERERLGPNRYVATLGVVFDRGRATQYLGTDGEAQRSAPMLLLPVVVTAGTATMYERRNPWQRAWAEFQSGASRVNYVRPSGAGGESLLLTYGQTGRRSRIWWRDILDEFGAGDILVPMAELRYAYPGGPITGRFTGRHGPDGRVLGSFSMTARGPAELPAMLGQAVRRFDTMFQQALAAGVLEPDPTLDVGTNELPPRIAQLVELGRAFQNEETQRRRTSERAAGAADPVVGTSDGTITDAPINRPPPEGSVALYTVQVATPDAPAYDDALAGVRGAVGVRSTGVRSTAIGGTSVLTVSYSGSIDQLAAALRERGFTVTQSGSALSIAR